MNASWNIPRNCLAWILISQVALIIPHFQRLPVWVLVVCGCCAIWRIMVFQGRWSFPVKIVKVLFSIFCFLGIFQSYGTLIGMEPTVALLFTGFSLKLLEVVTKRDVYVIIFLGYFVAITEFLFSQNFLIVVFVFITVLIITTALVALHQQGYQRFDLISLRKTLVLFMQAAPLMVVLFIIFPRFEPLWKVPMPSHQAKSGISETLSPGDISNLSQSSELAFRAYFTGEVPSREKLYWRGLVMSEFDGRTWRQGKLRKDFFSKLESQQHLQSFQAPILYSVTQEPSYQPWLFTLALAHSSDKNILAVNDYRLIRDGDIHTRIKYDVTSDLSVKMELKLSDKVRRTETLLPFRGNALSKNYARQMRNQYQSDKEFVDAVLINYFLEKFTYTLKPPLLGEDSIDDFLFNTQKGFCGHFASSFVFLMRSVDIPARVVSGYHGGELNPITGTILVHQFDAHAWAEVWLENKGWVRFDPTAMVSPDRIEYGLENALREEGSFLSDSPLSPLRYRDVVWINKLRLQLDAYSYYWSTWVLQYKGKRQLDLMTRLLGEISPFRVAAFMLGVGGLILFLVAFDVMKGRGKPKPPLEVQLYLKLCHRLHRAGFERLKHEGPIVFAQRITTTAQPWAPHVLAATRAFVTLSYEPISNEQKPAIIKHMKREVLKASYQLRLS